MYKVISSRKRTSSVANGNGHADGLSHKFRAVECVGGEPRPVSVSSFERVRTFNDAFLALLNRQVCRSESPILDAVIRLGQQVVSGKLSIENLETHWSLLNIDSAFSTVDHRHPIICRVLKYLLCDELNLSNASNTMGLLDTLLNDESNFFKECLGEGVYYHMLGTLYIDKARNLRQESRPRTFFQILRADWNYSIRNGDNFANAVLFLTRSQSCFEEDTRRYLYMKSKNFLLLSQIPFVNSDVPFPDVDLRRIVTLADIDDRSRQTGFYMSLATVSRADERDKAVIDLYRLFLAHEAELDFNGYGACAVVLMLGTAIVDLFFRKNFTWTEEIAPEKLLRFVDRILKEVNAQDRSKIAIGMASYLLSTVRVLESRYLVHDAAIDPTQCCVDYMVQALFFAEEAKRNIGTATVMFPIVNGWSRRLASKIIGLLDTDPQGVMMGFSKDIFSSWTNKAEGFFRVHFMLGAMICDVPNSQLSLSFDDRFTLYSLSESLAEDNLAFLFDCDGFTRMKDTHVQMKINGNNYVFPRLNLDAFGDFDSVATFTEFLEVFDQLLPHYQYMIMELVMFGNLTSRYYKSFLLTQREAFFEKTDGQAADACNRFLMVLERYFPRFSREMLQAVLGVFSLERADSFKGIYQEEMRCPVDMDGYGDVAFTIAGDVRITMPLNFMCRSRYLLAMTQFSQLTEDGLPCDEDGYLRFDLLSDVDALPFQKPNDTGDEYRLYSGGEKETCIRQFISLLTLPNVGDITDINVCVDQLYLANRFLVDELFGFLMIRLEELIQPNEILDVFLLFERSGLSELWDVNVKRDLLDRVVPFLFDIGVTTSRVLDGYPEFSVLGDGLKAEIRERFIAFRDRRREMMRAGQS